MLVYQNIPKLQNLLKNPYKFKLIFSYSTWRATDIQLSQESDLYDTFWRAHFCIYYVMYAIKLRYAYTTCVCALSQTGDASALGAYHSLQEFPWTLEYLSWHYIAYFTRLTEHIGSKARNLESLL